MSEVNKITLTEDNPTVWVDTPNGSLFIHVNKYTGLWKMTAWNSKMGLNGERPSISKKISTGSQSQRIYDIRQEKV